MANQKGDFMRIRGEDFPTDTAFVSQKKLLFYPENPRIFSLIGAGEKVPDQDAIEKKLRSLEHVRSLKEDIKDNGGLMDPIIVKKGDMVVLEGNSRLAAFRILAEQDPVKWDEIRCTLLPEDMPEDKIFALLGQYHVKGKKDWAPYEQAGFLYRRHKDHGVEISAIASDLGLKQNYAKQLIKTYQFMIDKNDTDRDRWSYYYEFLKSKPIASARQNYPSFDETIVKKIKAGDFQKAADLRDKLPVICKSPAKNVKRFLEGIVDVDEAYERARYAGTDHVALQRVKRFRAWIGQPDTEEDILAANPSVINKLEFQLKQLKKTLTSVHSAVAKKKAGG
ncbi:MAG: ParB N-terminal domain-containing protein [Parasphingopyxis sp.]|uniref:hypothetical protein n=1 Tax=Parasphingopyxis sp. TaxID=1920299 RepID=UPI003F9FA83D